MQENDVELKDCIAHILLRIAGDFWAAGLITKDVEYSLHLPGVSSFELAAKLMNACQPSLEQYPEKNFLKFIAVLKKYEIMEQLATEMETKFEQARELYVKHPARNMLSWL